MVKHTQTIRQQKPANCLSLLDYFVRLALKRLIFNIFKYLILWHLIFCLLSMVIRYNTNVKNLWRLKIYIYIYIKNSLNEKHLPQIILKGSRFSRRISGNFSRFAIRGGLIRGLHVFHHHVTHSNLIFVARLSAWKLYPSRRWKKGEILQLNLHYLWCAGINIYINI